MNMASKELCEELYKVSGWYDTFAWYCGDTVEFEREAGYEGSVHENTIKYDWCTDIPAYDLGYLLRKLPKTINYKGLELFAIQEFDPLSDDRYENYVYQYVDDGYIYPVHSGLACDATEPENALCGLLIELFKQGILKAPKEGDE